MYEICEDAWNDGVKYLEVRFSPILHLQQGLSLGGVMEAVCEGLTLARYHFPIHVNIIVCAMRQLPSEQTQDIAEIAWRYRHKGVCGFDLAGPENGFSSKLHRAAFEIVRSKGIFCTLHSGEAAGWESVRDSIRYCGANRIGHGVHLIDNPALLEYVVAHRIPIESCPTSNVQTKAVESIADHPIRKFFDAGAIVVPCTDNTTVSDCTLTGEYMLIQEKFGFTVEEIVRMLDYGFQSAFITATEKRRLRADALHETLTILSSEGYDISPILKQDVYYGSIGLNLAELSGSCAIVDRGLSNKLPREVLAALPKTDLHCRLDGSISIDLLWKEIQDTKFDLTKVSGREIATKEELLEFLNTAEEKGLSHIAKDITKAMLQRPGQLDRAVEDILRHAVAEGVRYMELVVRPISHTAENLSPITVVDIVSAKIRELRKAALPIKVGIVIYASFTVDDPIAFRQMAELTVRCRKEPDPVVVGFGVYGDDPVDSASFRFFTSTFEYLKANNVNVSMVAGVQGAQSILTAIHDGGASRVSGAFQLHTFPRLMNYFAATGTPVELCTTSSKFREHTKGTEFAGNSLRLFIDNGVPVTLCSFRGRFDKRSRIDGLEAAIEDCKLTVPETLKLLSNGFMYNFQNSVTNKQLVKEFWEESKKILTENKITNIFDIAFFPPLPPPSASH